MDQRRAVGAKFALNAVEPQYRLALAFGDRLPRPAAVDIFPRRIDRLRPALGLFPIVLECAAALELRLVDLAMRMQLPQRIVAQRPQRDDLFSGLQAQGIVDFDRRDFGVARQIRRSPVMNLCQFLSPVAFGSCHVGCLHEGGCWIAGDTVDRYVARLAT